MKNKPKSTSTIYFFSEVKLETEAKLNFDKWSSNRIRNFTLEVKQHCLAGCYISLPSHYYPFSERNHALSVSANSQKRQEMFTVYRKLPSNYHCRRQQVLYILWDENRTCHCSISDNTP